MMTFRFWRAILQPPATRLDFVGSARMVSTRVGNRVIVRQRERKRGFTRSVPFVGCLGALILGVTFPGIFVLTFLIPFLAPLLLLLNNTIFGLRWAIGISGAIAREHVNRSYDLLALAQDGHWGVSWRIASAHLHYNQRLERHDRRGRYFMLVVALLTILGALTIHPNTALFGVTYIAILYIDLLQSTVLAVLLGILLPTFSQNPRDTRIMALGALLSIQVITYALTWVIVIFSAQLVRESPSGLAILIVALFAVCTFYLIREAVIFALWRTLQRRLELPAHEMRLRNS